jgi:glycerol kinase
VLDLRVATHKPSKMAGKAGAASVGPFVGSIDQGTSSTRFMIFNKRGEVVSVHQVEHTQYFPQPGWVEHDPLEIWKNTQICINEAMKNAKIRASDLASVGVTNQRETTVIWNRITGNPYHNAIVWNDSRTSHQCEKLNKRGFTELFKQRTGLPIASYFSASKIMYIMNAVKGIRKDAENGDVLFGTMDTWLIWNLTNRRVHATDVTNASRTLLMNLKTLKWDEELMSVFSVPKSLLPAIKSSSEVFGTVDVKDSEIDGVKISGVLGDQQAALFGQTCFRSGETKCTFGTGAFMLMNIGSQVTESRHGLLTTVAYKIGNNSPVYALEGSVAYSGSLVQWLRDNLNVISSASESEAIAESVADNGGVYFVPAFSGLFAPYWRDDARGVIAGLTAYNTKAHIIRAALEANGFQTKEIIDAMKTDSSLSLQALRVDGGLTANNLAMQFLSDILNSPLRAPVVTETTALGAAMAAGLAVGLWSSLDELRSMWTAQREWNPNMDETTRCKQVII